MKSIFILICCFCSMAAFSQQTIDPLKKDTADLKKNRQLAAVVVKSKKPFIERQVDKLVLNVQSDIVAASGTVFEVLQRAPGVSVTNDEVINMAGKAGVNILIDGRPTQLSAKDLADYLKATPGALVEKIEIIMNPSAKYDAQGNAGIINIRMKKNTIRGTNGNITSAYTQSVHPNINLSANINHRKGKWNWFADAAARKSRQHTDGSINRFVLSNGINKVFQNTTVDEDASANLAYTAGADWYINSKHTFGFIIKGNEYKSKLYTPGTTLIRANDITDSSLNTLNDNRVRTSANSFNLNYHYQDTLGVEWNIDADHAAYRKTTRGFVTTDLLDKQLNRYGYTANDQDLYTGIFIYSIKTDFTKQLKSSHAKIESGLKWNQVSTQNDLDASVWNINRFMADTGRTNFFRYTETMFAAYTSFSQQVKKWEYQLGLRAEQSVIKGRSTDLKSTILRYPDTSYLNIFPSAFIRYQADDKNSVGLSYGRRINRPGYQDLNPFEYIFDNYARERGNPYLLPEFSNNLEFNYSYRNALNVGIGFSTTINSFQEISTLNGEITTASNYNAGEEKRFYLNLGLGIPVTKWWDSYINLTPHYKQYRGSIQQGSLDNNAWGMDWYGSEDFSLPKKWKLQLSTWGSIATRNAMTKTAWLGSLGGGVSKPMLKDKLVFRLAVTDIFNTQRWLQTVDFGNVHYNYLRKWESSSVRLQFTWKFGKTSFTQRERELGSKEATERIK